MQPGRHVHLYEPSVEQLAPIVVGQPDELLPRDSAASRRGLQLLDSERPLRTTSDMATWYTVRPCAPTAKSHVNFCVFDSTWEAAEAFTLDHDPHVVAWVKNDHLGFDIHYVHHGAVRRYRPDFLIRLTNGVTLVLEVKGEMTDEARTKRAALADWVAAVNDHGGFGRWASDVSVTTGDVAEMLERHAVTC